MARPPRRSRVLWRCATQARDAIADPANLVVVSAASAWEISVKKALGRLAAPDDLAIVTRDKRFEDCGVVLLPAASMKFNRILAVHGVVSSSRDSAGIWVSRLACANDGPDLISGGLFRSLPGSIHAWCG
jgi:hypothetical protein